jgi:hypothetical protein
MLTHREILPGLVSALPIVMHLQWQGPVPEAKELSSLTENRYEPFNGG